MVGYFLLFPRNCPHPRPRPGQGNEGHRPQAQQDLEGIIRSRAKSFFPRDRSSISVPPIAAGLVPFYYPSLTELSQERELRLPGKMGAFRIESREFFPFGERGEPGKEENKHFPDMELHALLLILAASVLHATWNFLAKRSRDKLALFWWAMLVALFCCLPPLLWGQPWRLPTAGWGWAAASGLLQALYCLLLGLAYHEGDLSIVYPLSRGTAPLLMVMWGAWFLDERLSLKGGVGILLVVLGVYVLHLPALTLQAFWEPFRRLRERSSQLALGVAVLISLYQLLDKRGTAVWPPWLYACTLYTCLFVWLCLLLPFVRTRAQLVAAWQEDWWNIVPVGLLLFLAYALVLLAMRQVQLGYLGAIRNVSIVIGALLGVVFLKEPFGHLRLLGAGLIGGGVACIALGP